MKRAWKALKSLLMYVIVSTLIIINITCLPQGAMLQCNADIIKEISAVDTVTTSMLAKACVEVQKSMERNWFVKIFLAWVFQTGCCYPIVGSVKVF